MRMRPILPLLLAGTVLLPPLDLVAQDPVALPAGAELDVAEPLVAPAGAHLASGSWSYRVLLSRGGNTIELARRTLTIGPSSADSTTTLVVDETDSHGQVMADTTFLSTIGLSPRRRSANMGPLRLMLRFGVDSVRGTMSAPGSDTVQVSLPVVPGLVASGGVFESLLTVAPLGEGWSGTAVQVAPGPNGTSLVPATIRILAADSVTVPAGSFAVWKAVVTTGGVEQWLWLDRTSGRLVRSEMKPPQASDVVYVTELTAAAPEP